MMYCLCPMIQKNNSSGLYKAMKIYSFAIFLILLFSTAAHSFEISELKLKLLKDPSNSWMPFAVDTNYNSYLTEFNLYEKQEDGSILSPVYIIDKYSKPLTRVGWLRFGCADENVSDLGEFKDGKFERDNLLSSDHLVRQIRYFFCPTTSVDGKRVIAVKAEFNANKKVFSLSGFSIDDLEQNKLGDTDLLNGLFYNLTFKDEKIVTNAAIKFEVNCKENSVFSPIENKKFNTNNEEGKQLRFFLNSICKTNDILAGITINSIKKQLNPSGQDISTSSKQEKKKLTIDEAKIQCKEIGFKEKTEKFGSCIMDLIK